MNDSPACDFCGKNHEQVKTLIVSPRLGPAVANCTPTICNECVISHMEVLATQSRSYREELAAIFQVRAPGDSKHDTNQDERSDVPVHCCAAMDSFCRTQWRNVPEAEQRDASIEFMLGAEIYLIASSNGTFTTTIRHCPWCGADLLERPNPVTAA